MTFRYRHPLLTLVLLLLAAATTQAQASLTVVSEQPGRHVITARDSQGREASASIVVK